MFELFLVVHFAFAGLVPETSTLTEKSQFYNTLNQYNYTLRYFEDRGLGLVYNRDIKVDENIICVPQDLHIRHTESFPFTPYISSLSALEKLACRVLYEKFQSTKDKFVRHYINTIPADLPSSLTWASSTWALLEKFSVFSNISNNLDNSQYYTSIQNALKGLLNVNPAIYKNESIEWALQVVNTRSLKFIGENKEDILILVPYIDLINYWPKPLNNDHFSLYVQDDMICVRSPFDRTAGNEVLIDYGSYESSYFFTRYLFTVPNNPYDYVPLRYRVKHSTETKNYELRAYMVNEELLDVFIFQYDQDLSVVDRLRPFFMKNEEKRKSVVRGLLDYRRVFKAMSELRSMPGIRETRRHFPLNPDEKIVMDFALASRTTVYNHQRSLEREILFAFHSDLLSN